MIDDGGSKNGTAVVDIGQMLKNHSKERVIMENKRSSWGSNIGFLLAALGSAVGLGNVWGFPFKMGKGGGFTFLIVYLLLAIFVGMIIMVSELALGRKTRRGVVGAYQAVSKNFKWIGWLGMLAPFLIMSFYNVLGGYCIQYLSLNLAELSFKLSNLFNAPLSGGLVFGAMCTTPLGCCVFTLLFIFICMLIVQGGVDTGIEKFNKIAMPALFVMLLIIIARSLTLPNASEGLKFMFMPGYAVKAGFIEKAPNFVEVLGLAGSQMFFSLSLAMGAMITYGSYLDKKEKIVKNSSIIVISDTVIALLAGLAVIPASIAVGIENGVAPAEIAGGLAGPGLLFVTLQDVFASMGSTGPIFGIIFYLLVLIAAVSSAISLLEAVSAYFLDKAAAKGKVGNRKKIVFWVAVAVIVEAMVVAADGLGANGMWVPFQKTLKIAAWNDCWLDFMDVWSEGIAMPLGAVLMALMVGWELRPHVILDEIHNEGHSPTFEKFYTLCIKFIVPIVMTFVFAGQMISFFTYAGTGTEKLTATLSYAIAGGLLVLFFIVALFARKNKSKTVDKLKISSVKAEI